MTKKQLIEEMKDFPDDATVFYIYDGPETYLHLEIKSVRLGVDGIIFDENLEESL